MIDPSFECAGLDVLVLIFLFSFYFIAGEQHHSKASFVPKVEVNPKTPL